MREICEGEARDEEERDLIKAIPLITVSKVDEEKL